MQIIFYSLILLPLFYLLTQGMPVALNLDGEPGSCIAWSDPAIGFFHYQFEIELIYKTNAQAKRSGDADTMLALASNLRIDHPKKEPHTRQYGRHFQILLDDRQGTQGYGQIVVQWMARYSHSSGELRSNISIIDDRWHMIKLSRDIQLEKCELSIDGIAIAEAPLPRNLDLEPQDQQLVIGGCYNGRYREGSIAFIRLKADQRVVGFFRFYDTDELFAGRTSYIIDRSHYKNDAFWIKAPVIPKYSKFTLNLPNPPLVAAETPIITSGIVLTSLLSGNPSGSSYDEYGSMPFYMLNLISDCRRLHIQCVILYDKADVITPQLAEISSSNGLTFFNINQLGVNLYQPWMRNPGKARVWYMKAYLQRFTSEQIPYILHLDLRDGRINQDPFQHMIAHPECDIFLQQTEWKGVMCSGVAAARYDIFMNFLDAWINAMPRVSNKDDQVSFNLFITTFKPESQCQDQPFVNPQKTRLYRHKTFIEHGNWFMEAKNSPRPYNPDDFL